MATAPGNLDQHDRPLSVTLVIIGVFLLGLLNAWRALALGQQRGFMLELGIMPDPLVRLVMAAVWSGLFLLSAVGLWRRQPYLRFVLPVGLLIYVLYQLAFPVLFGATTQARSGLPAFVVLYSLGLIFIIWALNHRAARDYFEHVA